MAATRLCLSKTKFVTEPISERAYCCKLIKPIAVNRIKPNAIIRKKLIAARNYATKKMGRWTDKSRSKTER